MGSRHIVRCLRSECGPGPAIAILRGPLPCTMRQALSSPVRSREARVDRHSPLLSLPLGSSPGTALDLLCHLG